jgi:internalin A
MPSWQDILLQLQNITKAFIRMVKARRREEAAIGIAAFLFWLGHSLVGWFPADLQDFIKSWHGNLIIPAVFYSAGLSFLGYGVYHLWRLVREPDLPAVTNRASAIKGPLAFTPADGELFRKLGREDELKKLLSYIEDDQISLIVLMGASGAGKTSLLRAGLTNILKDEIEKKKIHYHYWESVPTDSGRGLLKTIQDNGRSDLHNGTSHTSSSTQTVELKSLDELVTPSSVLSEGRHVIVLDQFEQLRGNTNGEIFRLLRKVARKAKPPHRITWIVAFRREFRADWSDFIIPEHERGFFPPELSLRLFTSEQASDVISQLVQEAGLSVEQAVVNNLIKAAAVDGEVSSVDIGIGILVLSEIFERQAGKTITEDVYHFAGEAEGLLIQYINGRLELFPDEDRQMILNAMLALRVAEANQRIAEGKSAAQLAEEIKAEPTRLKTRLERLIQRDIRLLEHASLSNSEETLYRLPHERLISSLNRLAGPILGEVEEAKLKFATAFSAWKNHHSSQYLLRGKDLRLIEQHKKDMGGSKDEQEKLIFLKHSRRQRSVKRLLSVVLIVCLLTTGWFANSQYQQYDAKKELEREDYPIRLYDWQHQLKSLKLKKAFDIKRLPWLHSNSLEEFKITAVSTTNSLEGLVNALSKCPAIKILDLNLNYSQVSNLDALKELKNLQQLTLSLIRTQVSNLDVLKELKSLQQLTLSLSGTQGSNLDALKELKSLQQLTLSLSYSPVSNLDVLKELKSLQQLTLDLSDSPVSNLDALKELKNLQQLTLNLSDSPVSNLDVLKELKSLQQLTLSLSGTQVSNLDALKELKNLQQLTLSLIRTQVSNLDILKELKSLQQLTLSLSATPVSNLDVLKELKSLQQLTLDLDYSPMSNLDALKELKSFQQLTLSLSGTQGSNLDALKELKNLQQLTLSLSATPVSNLDVLKELKSLQQLTLDLSATLVSDLDALKELKNLQQLTLSLSSTQGSNFDALKELKSLQQLTLDFSATQVSNLDALKELKNLQQLILDIRSTQVSNLDVLKELKSLQQLTLDLSATPVSNLTVLEQLNPQKLDLTLTTEQRRSLKSLPKSVIHLAF